MTDIVLIRETFGIFVFLDKIARNLLCFSETPATAAMKIFFNDKDAIHMRDPAEIKITWDAYNLTSNFGAGVQISLWGYREVKTTPEFEYITLLEVCIGLSDVRNTSNSDR